MTAKGKLTGSALAKAVEAGQDVRVLVTPGTVYEGQTLMVEHRLTAGQSVRLTSARSRLYRNDYGRSTRVWEFTTDTGVLKMTGQETVTLTPETPAGIKRAYQEALAEDELRTAQAALAETLDKVLPADESRPAQEARVQAILDLPAETPAGKGPAVMRTLEDATDVVTIRPEVAIPGLKREDGTQVTVQVPDPKMGQDMSALPLETTYRVTFSSIGRTRSPLDLDVVVPAEDAWNAANVIGHAVHRYAGTMLLSRWFDVDVDLTYGRVLIDGGRFGEGKAVILKDA